MKAQLITLLIQSLLSILTPDLLKKFADMVLDFAENLYSSVDKDVLKRVYYGILSTGALPESFFDVSLLDHGIPLAL